MLEETPVKLSKPSASSSKGSGFGHTNYQPLGGEEPLPTSSNTGSSLSRILSGGKSSSFKKAERDSGSKPKKPEKERLIDDIDSFLLDDGEL